MSARITNDEAGAIAASVLAVQDISVPMLLMFEGMTKKRANEIMDIMEEPT